MAKENDPYAHLPCATCNINEPEWQSNVPHEHTCIRTYAYTLDKELHLKVRLCERIGQLMDALEIIVTEDDDFCTGCCYFFDAETAVCECENTDDLGMPDWPPRED